MGKIIQNVKHCCSLPQRTVVCLVIWNPTSNDKNKLITDIPMQRDLIKCGDMKGIESIRNAVTWRTWIKCNATYDRKSLMQTCITHIKCITMKNIRWRNWKHTTKIRTNMECHIERWTTMDERVTNKAE